MCSIFGVFHLKADPSVLRAQALAQSKLLRHRGPDWSGIYQSNDAILVHERLAIVDVNNGAQPLVSANGNQILAVNGEIYNHKRLKTEYAEGYQFKTESDCEVILPLYQHMGADCLKQLSGMYAFMLFDQTAKAFFIARDPIGIIPLYMGHDELGQLYFASEMKAIEKLCEDVSLFPPGHYLSSRTLNESLKDKSLSPQQAIQTSLISFYQRDWKSYEAVSQNRASATDIRQSLTHAVKSHLMTDVPYGVLLSGGLDSSIVAALAKQFADKRVEDDSKSQAWWPSLHTFAIGLEGSPDLAAAKKVADHIGSIHHSLIYTLQDGIDALSDVIYHLETYDVTTIRASTPMYLMARKIRAMGIKMVLSGEGSDELFGGYLYFHKAPNAKEFHQETVRKLEKLHYYDCLRANKAMAAWGVEARVPFLDKDFIDVAMRTNPEAKMITSSKIEKHILREAFADLLPDEVVWRQKEQFSDGVGYGWIDGLKAMAEQKVTDEQLSSAHFKFPDNPPQTKEAYWYREMFNQHFGSRAAALTVLGGKSVACSTAEALAWDASFAGQNDPSGRAVRSVHKSGY